VVAVCRPQYAGAQHRRIHVETPCLVLLIQPVVVGVIAQHQPEVGGRGITVKLVDNAYNDGLDQDYQAAVFNMYPAMLRTKRTVPGIRQPRWIRVRLRHEHGTVLRHLHAAETGGGGRRGLRDGGVLLVRLRHIHFVELESFETDRSPTGPMLTWLQRDLAANTSRGLSSFFPSPAPYSKGSHNSDTEIELVEMRQKRGAYPGELRRRPGALRPQPLVRAVVPDRRPLRRLDDVRRRDERRMAAAGRPTHRAPTRSHLLDGPARGTVYTVAVRRGILAAARSVIQRCLVAGRAGPCSDVLGNRPRRTFLDSTGVRRDYFSIVKGVSGLTPPSASPSEARPLSSRPREAERFR